MIAALTAVFLGLMVLGGLGTGTFVAVYLRSDWSSSAVGRHLLFYSSALFCLYVLSILSFVIHALWMAAPLLIGHAVFDGLIWQRVVLVIKAQRRG